LQGGENMDGLLLQSIEGLGEMSLFPNSFEIWEQLQSEKEEIANEIRSEGSQYQHTVAGVMDFEASDVCGDLVSKARSREGGVGTARWATPSRSIHPLPRDGTDESARDVAWHHREILEARVRQLNDAQDRLMDGGYGRCAECGDEIDERRLTADPATTLCLECQRTAEAVTNF
jgi:RNA polymerase-binding transcription factor DksA